MPEELSPNDKLSYYEDGKHRRYSLLFAVNGGAFAIARILSGVDEKSSDVLAGSAMLAKPARVLGHLTLPELAWGMILFTIIMVADIYSFGYLVRKNLNPNAFTAIGKLVLLSIGLLICSGWFLVAGR
jgi:hypothetical protein